MAIQAEAEAWANYQNSLANVEMQARTTYETLSGWQATADSFRTFGENMIQVAEEMAVRIDYLFQAMASAFANMIADVVTGEKTFEEALQGMFNALLRMAIDTIFVYIAQSIASALSHGASKGGVIGAGVEAGAMVGLAAALIPSLAFFADGGIVYGPTMGMVGEYPGARTNPEVIAPLSKLKDMMGGGAMELRGKFIIDGSDLAFIVNKENSKLTRYR
jgi:hypothetical protein